MEAFEMLRDYGGIDDKISGEVAMIHAGKKSAVELLAMLRGCPPDAVLQKKTLETLRIEMRDQELAHLLEYRRLIMRKLRIQSALNGLPKRSAEILQARACNGERWADIAGAHQYSISQVKRIYAVAFQKVVAKLKDDLL